MVPELLGAVRVKAQLPRALQPGLQRRHVRHKARAAKQSVLVLLPRTALDSARGIQPPTYPALHNNTLHDSACFHNSTNVRGGQLMTVCSAGEAHLETYEVAGHHLYVAPPAAPAVVPVLICIVVHMACGRGVPEHLLRPRSLS